MSKNEEGEREIPLRITNVEFSKLVKEKMAKSREVREENRRMKRELEKLKGKMARGVIEEYEGEEEGIEEREPRQERERIPTDQRAMLEALERVGRKDQRSYLPMFSGKLNLEECID